MIIIVYLMTSLGTAAPAFQFCGSNRIIRYFMQNQLDLTGTGHACFSIFYGSNSQLFSFPCYRNGTPLSSSFNPRRACAARVALCVCVSVCLSVTALAATAFVSTCNERHLRHYYRLFNSWIFDKAFRSKVMA